MGKILATKQGWLIGVDVIRETPKATIVKAWDEKRERLVPNDDQNQKLFDCTDAAQKWIGTGV